MILLDTSVLSLAFRHRRKGQPEPLAVAAFRRMLIQDAPVAVPGIVLQELLSGVRGDTEFALLKAIMDGFPLVLEDSADHVAAARIANACSRRGVPTSAVDCLVAALALSRKAALFTVDQNLARMAPRCGLILLKVPGSRGSL